MIKLGLKNYFKSYRHFFVPIGALALGIVLGLSIMIPWCISAIKDFVNGVAEQLGNIKWDWDAVRQVLLDALYALDWSVPREAMSEIFSTDYLIDLLKKCAEAALGDTSSISAEVERLATEAISKITAAIIVAVICTIVGAVVGFFAARVNIRRDMASRKLWKFLLVSLLDAIINVTFLAFALWLIAAVKNFALLAFVLSVFAYGIVAFFEAYFVHGYKKVPFKKVMQVRNFFALFLLGFIEIVIAIAIIVLVIAITNIAFGAFVGFSVLVITLICITLNAEAYVKDIAIKQGQTPELPTASPTTAEG